MNHYSITVHMEPESDYVVGDGCINPSPYKTFYLSSDENLKTFAVNLQKTGFSNENEGWIMPAAILYIEKN